MKQEISALMDGELEADHASSVIGRIIGNPSLQSEWAVYHMIGDALREQAFAAFDVGERVRQRLAEEPPVLAPRRSLLKSVRVYALSAAASIAAVAMVGWVVLQGQSEGERSVVAQHSSSAIASAAPAASPVRPASVLPPSGLNDYLLVHHGYSPSTQIQGMATYIRAVAHPEVEARQ
ncbi:sigma-E factor negative regulatory protein [Pelomicrobium methylotrophicum]|uniref:Sigma-E factor negative regulatory protein n=1 Tax=Pelomicrobium methylotrophicum TaxID=2602750 RepID=A0A5C7F1C1_9PROT|nr:sigma-E factor negative regulatory protein [Pelomicrobium methylotrophicum]TXF13578.1 sigma-E factor negative regulatory protein [Pelomicrobium methylotrophicum]